MASTVADSETETETVSQTVVAAVAELTDSEPMALQPLYSAVDPDALNALFESKRSGFGRSQPRVTFSYGGCDVEISDGAVTVSGSGQEITKRW